MCAWSRTARDDRGVDCNGVSHIAGAAALSAKLPRADIVVCLLPLTASTKGIIDSQLMSKVKWGATLVNAARGEHVVEEHLLAALDSGARVPRPLYCTCAMGACALTCAHTAHILMQRVGNENSRQT